jgi:signal-transduction protein with cAMP-binding, CBS, and nucleotidyltransferase domain
MRTSTVGTLITRPAVYVHPDVSLRTVAQMLTSEKIGLVAVGDSRHLMGIISERDVVRLVGEGADPDAERARDVMTEELVRVASATLVLDVAGLMLEHDIRHIVVAADGGRNHVVSVRDILASVIEDEIPPI